MSIARALGPTELLVWPGAWGVCGAGVSRGQGTPASRLFKAASSSPSVRLEGSLSAPGSRGSRHAGFAVV